MKLPTPAAFHSCLSPDRLQQVAKWLLEEFYATEDDLVRPTDTAYTRGCATFGRQRSRVIKEWQSSAYPWLGMLDSGNALVFTIEGVPCRFSNDSPDSPSKSAVLGSNPYQAEFASFVQPGAPVKYCFIVDRGLDGVAEPFVALDGYSESGTHMCRWTSDPLRAFRTVDAGQPEPVEVEKKKLGPKLPTESSDTKPVAANDDAPEKP